MITQAFGRRWSFRFKRVLLMVGLAVLGVAGPAWGDVPPQETEACKTAQVGASCQSHRAGDEAAMFTGSCQKETCSRLDYAHWDRDASAAPPSVQYECLKCVAPATDGGTADASDTAVVDPPLHPPDVKGESDGCSLSGPRAGRALGPWLMAGAVALMVSLMRRRRRG